MVPKENERKGISRRDFIKGAVAGAGGIAAAGILSGCSGSKGSSETAGKDGKHITSTWPGEPPVIDESKIKKTLKADVVIVGAGLAGLSAARAASEEGASVIVIEKAKTYQYRSGQFGIIDCKIQKQLGVKVDKNAAILENMKQMGYRADQRMWKYWADHSGEAFDWMLELAPEVEVIPHSALSYDENKIVLQPLHFPEPPGYDPAKEYSPAYPTVLTFLPDQGKMLELVYKRCLEKGCKFLFSTWARKLIRPGNKGRVEGVICEDINGEYMKVLAKKGVILAAGDFGSNKEMIAHLIARTFSPTGMPRATPPTQATVRQWASGWGRRWRTALLHR